MLVHLFQSLAHIQNNCGVNCHNLLLIIATLSYCLDSLNSTGLCLQFYLINLLTYYFDQILHLQILTLKQKAKLSRADCPYQTTHFFNI